MDLSASTVAVTGATGFLGSYISRALLAAGCQVRGVVRNPDKAPFLWSEGAEPFEADLSQRERLVEAFRGVDAIVSNAALFSIGKMANKHWEENYHANLVGTENVYRAAAEAGVKRIIQISTFGVYRWRLNRRLTEESPQLDGEKREGGAYRATKQLSERLAWKLAEELGLELTAMRPSAIYGARDPNTTSLAARMMNRAWYSPIFPAPWFCFPLVYAGDVAEACAAALREPASIGHAFNVGGDDRTWLYFLWMWKRVGGFTMPVLLPMPNPLPIPWKFGFYLDNTKAQKTLGFSNRPFEQGLRETFEQEPDLLRGVAYQVDREAGRA